MQRHNKTKRPHTGYHPNRTCYLSSDGKYYCYDVWDSSGRTKTTLRFEIGKDGLTEELTLYLDSLDHDEDLNNRYQDELRDSYFDTKITNYKADSNNEDAVNPWDTIADSSGSPEDVLFTEPEPENPKAVEARRVIEEECTAAQQNFYFEHFGMGTPLEEIRQAESKRTGKLPSSAAMTNRKNKIVDKAAKALGTERVKRHRYPQKG